MRLASFESIAQALHDASVRYLIAGGLAVNAHGYLRFTKDVDVVLQLEGANVRRALAALAALGYRPAIPVRIEEFADPAKRRTWVTEKGMQVFQLWSDAHVETPIDVFVDEPFPFDEEYGRALVRPLGPGLDVRFVSIATLIRMKDAADREQDRIDIANLRLKLDE